MCLPKSFQQSFDHQNLFNILSIMGHMLGKSITKLLGFSSSRDTGYFLFHQRSSFKTLHLVGTPIKLLMELS